MKRQNKRSHFFIDFVQAHQWVSPFLNKEITKIIEKKPEAPLASSPPPDEEVHQAEPVQQRGARQQVAGPRPGEPSPTHFLAAQTSAEPVLRPDNFISRVEEASRQLLQDLLPSSSQALKNSSSGNFSSLKEASVSSPKLLAASSFNFQKVFSASPIQGSITPSLLPELQQGISISHSILDQLFSSSASESTSQSLNASSIENAGSAASFTKSYLSSSIQSLVSFLKSDPSHPSLALASGWLQESTQFTALKQSWTGLLVKYFEASGLPNFPPLLASRSEKGASLYFLEHLVQNFLAALLVGAALNPTVNNSWWVLTRGLAQLFQLEIFNPRIHSPLLEELGALFSTSRRRLRKETKKRILNLDRVSRKDSFLAEADPQEKEEEKEALLDLSPKNDSNNSSTSFYYM